MPETFGSVNMSGKVSPLRAGLVSRSKWMRLTTSVPGINPRLWATAGDPELLIDKLRAANFGVTCVEGEGVTGKVQIVLTVMKRRQLPEVVALIETHHPGAFYAVDDLQSANEGIFPQPKARPGIVPISLGKTLAKTVSGMVGKQAV